MVILAGAVSGADFGKVMFRIPLSIFALMSSFFTPGGSDSDLENLPYRRSRSEYPSSVR